MQNKFFLADALAIDHDRKVVTCNDGVSNDNFEVKYDKLAIATGSQGSTFGIPGKTSQQFSSYSMSGVYGFSWVQSLMFGTDFKYHPGVEEKAHFLRDVSHSSAIRKHLIQNWNMANLPSKHRLLVDLYVMLEDGSPKFISWVNC